jgi:hypothetical protein
LDAASLTLQIVMVEAISAVYGSQIKLSVLRRRQRSGTPIARWGNVDNSVFDAFERLVHSAQQTDRIAAIVVLLLSGARRGAMKVGRMTPHWMKETKDIQYYVPRTGFKTVAEQ